MMVEMENRNANSRLSGKREPNSLECTV